MPISSSPMTSSRIISPWQNDLNHDWSLLRSKGRQVSFKLNEVIYREESSCQFVYVIDSGRVRLVSHSPDGHEGHLMVFGSGGLIGDAGLFNTRRHTTCAQASSLVHATQISVETLLKLRQDAVISEQLLVLADLRLSIMVQHYQLLRSASALQRVAFNLLALLNSYGCKQEHAYSLNMVFTQQEMADICHLSRVSVSQVLGQLECKGILARKGRALLILDSARLALESGLTPSARSLGDI